VCDSSGAAVDHSGVELNVSLVSPSGKQSKVVTTQYFGGGRYEAAYLTLEAGTHQICVQLSGQHIRGSPFSVEVRAAEASAAHCSLIVPAEFERGIYAFESAQLQLQTRDRFGNALTTGGHCVAVRPVEGQAEFEVTDSDNGRYSIAIRPLMLSGTLQFSILCDGRHTPGSPVTAKTIVDLSSVHFDDDGPGFQPAGGQDPLLPQR
jgi:hypothetical protein